MSVICKAVQCPYESGGTCHRGVTILNSTGICAYLWREDGQIRQNRVGKSKIDKENLAVERYVAPTDIVIVAPDSENPPS